MDAGHLGQRLNLAAIRLNLGAASVFDDQVNEVLGIPDMRLFYISLHIRADSDKLPNI